MAERASFRADVGRRASVREALQAERAAERGVVFVRDIFSLSLSFSHFLTFYNFSCFVPFYKCGGCLFWEFFFYNSLDFVFIFFLFQFSFCG